jgi:hypothetical protein
MDDTPVSLDIDDEDAVDIVREIERSFDIVISNSEAAACQKLGDIHDLLRRRFADGQIGGEACASAMAFYRLRRALAGMQPDFKLRPSTLLLDITKTSVRHFFRNLEFASSLRLPQKDYSWIGVIGLTSAITGLLSVPIVGGFFGWWALISALMLLIGCSLLRFDPGAFPKDCRTLGDLAERVSILNFGRLAKEGARVGDANLWKALTELTSPYTSVPPHQMSREASLVRVQRKAA